MQFSDWLRLFGWTGSTSKLTNSIANAFGDPLSDPLHSDTPSLAMTTPLRGGTRLAYNSNFSSHEVGAITHTLEGALLVIERTAPLAYGIVTQAAAVICLERSGASKASLSPGDHPTQLRFDNPQMWVGDFELVANELLAAALLRAMKLCLRPRLVHRQESERVFALCVSFALAHFWVRAARLDPSHGDDVNLRTACRAFLANDLLETMKPRRDEFARGVWRTLLTMHAEMQQLCSHRPHILTPPPPTDWKHFESRQASLYPHIVLGGESRHVKVARSTLSALALERERELLATLGEVERVQKIVGHGDRWLATKSYETFDFDSLSPSTLVKLFAQLARTLGGVHERRVVHRELRPEHIVRDENGPTLIHFASACRLDSPLATVHSGSLPWAPPDQVLPGVLEPGADWDTYALLVSLFSALTGQLPGFREDILNERGKAILALIPIASEPSSTFPRRQLTALRENLRYEDLLAVQEAPTFFAGDRSLLPGYLVRSLSPVFERGLHAQRALRFHHALELADALDAICIASSRTSRA